MKSRHLLSRSLRLPQHQHRRSSPLPIPSPSSQPRRRRRQTRRNRLRRRHHQRPRRSTTRPLCLRSTIRPPFRRPPPPHCPRRLPSTRPRHSTGPRAPTKRWQGSCRKRTPTVVTNRHPRRLDTWQPRTCPLPTPPRPATPWPLTKSWPGVCRKQSTGAGQAVAASPLDLTLGVATAATTKPSPRLRLSGRLVEGTQHHRHLRATAPFRGPSALFEDTVLYERFKWAIA